MLPAESESCRFRQVPAEVAATEADVLTFPIAEMAKPMPGGLALATRDGGGDPAVDEAADARQQDVGPSPDFF